MIDVLIIGSGPAGISAALTLRARGKSATIISLPRELSGLYKAERIDNYPGLPGITGADFSNRLYEQAMSAGVEFISARVTSALASKTGVSVAYGSETISASALILAVGSTPATLFEGEERLLGKGISYCATCDGMLYRKRRVAVCAYSHDSEEDIKFLQEIGCDVTVVHTKNVKLYGEARLQYIEADGERIDCDAAFILRETIAPSSIISGLITENGTIAVDREQRTNIQRVFAAGDCTGAPKQIAKAVGEGQRAAFSALAVK